MGRHGWLVLLVLLVVGLVAFLAGCTQGASRQPLPTPDEFRQRPTDTPPVPTVAPTVVRVSPTATLTPSPTMPATTTATNAPLMTTATSVPATATPQPTSTPTTPPTIAPTAPPLPTPPSAPPPPPRPDRNAAIAQQITTYLTDNFGIPGAAASWYPYIGPVAVSGATVTVATTAPANAQGKTIAEGICRGVSGFVYANPNRALGLTQVKILAVDGTPLIFRQNVAGLCS